MIMGVHNIRFQAKATVTGPIILAGHAAASSRERGRAMFNSVKLTNFVGYVLVGAVALPLTAFLVTMAQNILAY